MIAALIGFFTRPSRDTRLILERIEAMSAEFTALKTAFENYAANVAAVMERHKAEVDAAVAKAIDEHDVECSTDIRTLKEEIAAANARLVPPPFEPSNN